MTLNELRAELNAVCTEWESCDCHDTLMELEDRMGELETQIAALTTGETFDKTRFNWDGTFLTYTRLSGERVFIARMKYAAQKKNKAVYRRELAGQNVDLFLKLAEMSSPAEALSRVSGTLV
jgi:hypothetical protein